MRFRLITFIVATALLVAPAMGEFHKGDFELSISAMGVTPADGDSFTTAGTIGIGAFVTDAIELSLRQGVGYSDTAGSNWSFATQGAADYHFKVHDRVYLFGGGFVGVGYGDGIDATWTGGPEAGVKFFLSDTTILGFTVQVPFPFEGGDPSFNYSLGLSFLF